MLTETKGKSLDTSKVATAKDYVLRLELTPGGRHASVAMAGLAHNDGALTLVNDASGYGSATCSSWGTIGKKDGRCSGPHAPWAV